MSAPGEIWEPAPPAPDLPPGEVQVWRIPLDVPAESVERCRTLLAPDEWARAERFRFERDRGHFVVGRATLRTILGRVLGAEPAALAFRYGPQGKPALATGFEGSGVEFNLSHSRGLALLAVTRRRGVGVDIEALRPLADGEGIVRRFFSAAECAEFFRVPEALRVATFYHGWTRKEAYMKATGKGFTLPLGDFSVSLTPGEPPRLRDVAGEPGEAGRWAFRDVDPGPGFLGAVAVEGHGWRLRCLRWDHS